MQSKNEYKANLLYEIEDPHNGDDELDLPATIGNNVTYKFDSKQNKFVISEKSSFHYLVLGNFPESEYEEDMRTIINNPKNLNSPSLIRRISFSVLFLGVLLLIVLFLLIVLAILVLDLVFLALSLYFIKESAKFCWIMRVKMINLSRFSNLRRELKKLNQKYLSYELEWTLNNNQNWLQLGKYNTKYSIID